MKKLLLSLILIAGLLMIVGKGAFAQFSVNGEFRPRFEYRDGYAKLMDSTRNGYPTILGRSRVILDYKDEKFTARFSLQHAFVFGENNYSSDTITKNTVNIYEGFFSYKFAKMFAIKIGRTEMVYDDGRLLGNSNWGPKGATHDVAILQWENAETKHRADLGFAINNSAPAANYLTSYTIKNYKYMGYLFWQRKFFQEKLNVSLLGLMDAYQRPGIGNPELLYARFTGGGSLTYQKEKLKLFGSGYFQTGKFVDGKDLSAGMFSLYGSYQVVKPLTLLAGYEWLSGNNYSDTEGFKTKSTSFSTLYGTNHSFYGYMDLFNSYLSSGISAGLTDLYFRATYKFNDKVSLEGTYRYFSLQQGYLPQTAVNPGDLKFIEVDKPLGSEIDLMFVYKPVKSLEINTAYCFFLATETMERFSGLKPGMSEYPQYAYIQLTYRPNFFTAEKK